MKKQFSISEAKNRLPAIIHEVENGPAVQLTRHGKPVVVILSASQYQLLVYKKKDFWSALSNFKENFQDSEFKIEDADFDNLRDPSDGREVDLDL